MTKAFAQWVDEYAESLQKYLRVRGEESLQQAYEFGRRALADGMGVIDMGTLHHEAVRVVLRLPSPDISEDAIEAAQSFFAESLAPFEMTHRGFREAGAALRRMNEGLEAEAKRIAHTIHDESVQLLASVHVALDELAREIPAARQRLHEVRSMLTEIEEQLRRISHELRPTILDDLGLVPALKFLADGMAKRSGLEIAIEGSIARRLPSTIETAIYRIAQEALANVVRHAQASRVHILAEYDKEVVRCLIEDDGVGFDMTEVLTRSGERGFGLISIRERVDSLGGTLWVTSAPGHGTTLALSFPVEGSHVE